MLPQNACVFFNFLCHIHCKPLWIWKGMTELKLLLDAAQLGDRRLDYTSARHSKKKEKERKKRETETLWKKEEVCFWFQVAVKNVPCVLSVLAMDLPAFNTWVDKKLFIWILSAKKLPHSKVLNPARVQLVKMESGDDNVYFCSWTSCPRE